MKSNRWGFGVIRSPDGALESEFRRCSATDLLSLSTSVFVLFSVLAVAHVFVLPSEFRWKMFGIAASTAAVGLILRIRWKFSRPSESRPYLWTSLFVALAVSNSFMHLFFTRDVHQTTNLAFLVVLTGYFLLSMRWYVVMMVVELGGWVLAIVGLSTNYQDAVHSAWSLVVAAFISLVGNQIRCNLIRQSIAARSSERRYRDLYESMNEGLCIHELIYNEKSRPIDYRIIDVNPRFESILGIRREEAIGRLASDLYGTGLPPYLDEFVRAVEFGPVSFETYFEPMDKHFHVSVFSPGPEKFVTIFADISDRVNASEKLKASEQRFRALVESCHDAILVHNGENILFANPAAATIFGVSNREDLVGLPIMKFVSEKMKDLVRNRITETLHFNTAPTIEETLLRIDGSPFFADVVGVPINYDGVNAVQVMVRDITERKSMEEQLHQSNRLEAVGQLTGGIAHDFNNLLQIILTSTEIAMLKLEADSPVLSSLEEVTRANERAQDLIRHLLAFSRRQVMTPEVLNLCDVVQQMMDLIRRTIGEHIRFRFRSGPREAVCRVDPVMIEQVLINLCINARDAMPDGGELTVEVNRLNVSPQTEDRSRLGEIDACEPGEYATLEVIDTGTGMSEETKRHIFEPFFTTKGVGKGSGLGLSTVYGIIKQHNGYVRVSSELGKGTSFLVLFPYCDKKSEERKTPIQVSLRSGTETILYAEDNDMVRSVGCQLLEMGGYRVISAANGHQAISLFKTHRDEIELMFFDVVMPIMGGYEAYEIIRELAPEIPVLFASGYNEDAVQGRTELNNSFPLIQKPFTNEALLTLVRTTLDRKKRNE